MHSKVATFTNTQMVWWQLCLHPPYKFSVLGQLSLSEPNIYYLIGTDAITSFLQFWMDVNNLELQPNLSEQDWTLLLASRPPRQTSQTTCK